jgi:hypothetical protein
MDIPLMPPLEETDGHLTMTIAAFVNVDLSKVPAGPDGPANGAYTARLLDQALMNANLPAGCTVGATLLQLAVHSPH